MTKINTNWYVITGGPSSGKSKTLDSLAFRGYKIVPEAARILIDEEMSKGKTLQEVRANELEFQAKVLQMKLDTESKLDPNALLFLERGVADSIPFYELAGGDSQPLIEASKQRIYKAVFLLEQVSFEHDYARIEGAERANLISSLLDKTYTSLGFNVINVPTMPISKRVDFILSKISTK